MTVPQYQHGCLQLSVLLRTSLDKITFCQGRRLRIEELLVKNNKIHKNHKTENIESIGRVLQ